MRAMQSSSLSCFIKIIMGNKPKDKIRDRLNPKQRIKRATNKYKDMYELYDKMDDNSLYVLLCEAKADTDLENNKILVRSVTVRIVLFIFIYLLFKVAEIFISNYGMDVYNEYFDIVMMCWLSVFFIFITFSIFLSFTRRKDYIEVLQRKLIITQILESRKHNDISL